MISAAAIKETDKTLQSFLQQRPDIIQAILFGSLASGNERFESDVDLAIQLDHVMTADEKQNFITITIACFSCQLH